VLRPGPAVLLAVGHDDVGAGADAFDVRGEGRAAVPAVVILPGDSGAEQVKLAVEGGVPGGRRYVLRPSRAARKRRATCGEPAPARRISSKASRT
jgi:hypothetical protein